MRALAATVMAGAVLLLPGGTALAAGASSVPSAAVAASGSASAAPSAGATASASASPAPAASGNPLCSAVVVDSAGVLSGDEIETLRSAGEDLGQTTELRLRTVAQLAGGDLDAYEQQLQQSCHWTDASGRRQPTLLVLLLDTDTRKVGLYAGPGLTAVLTGPVWSGIEQKVVQPAVDKGDWTTGLQAALGGLDQLVGPDAAPSATFNPSALASAGGSGPSQSEPAASQPAAASGLVSPPVGGKGSGFPLAWVAAGAVVAIGVVVAGRLFVRRTSLRRPFGATPDWEPGQGSTLGLPEADDLPDSAGPTSEAPPTDGEH